MTTTASGLQYEDTVTGSGETASAGDHVTVHYTGWLHDAGAPRAAAGNSTRARIAAIRSTSRWVTAWSSAAGTKACRA